MAAPVRVNTQESVKGDGGAHKTIRMPVRFCGSGLNPSCCVIAMHKLGKGSTSLPSATGRSHSDSRTAQPSNGQPISPRDTFRHASAVFAL